MPDRRFRFEDEIGFLRPVPKDGYAWWYVDALSDDGRYGLTIIAFIGSVFSPYYAWARRQGRGDPYQHCSINVALYGPDKRRWAMTERGRNSLVRARDRLDIGPSALRWHENDGLTIQLEEISVPWLKPVRGYIRLNPLAIFNTAYALDAAAEHIWRPIAPMARVEVRLDAPDLTWDGHGYFDSNFGKEPLERAFSTWDWSRMQHPDHTSVLYDSRDLSDRETSMSLRFLPDGRVEDFAAPTRTTLPRTPWRMSRATRVELGTTANVVRTFEDSPFYTRSMLRHSTADGASIIGVHESLSLSRFSLPIVQAMLPFRMPRRFDARRSVS